MYLCMRTTIDIEDELAIRAKQVAAERRTSLKNLVEEGLRVVLAGKAGGHKPPMRQLRGCGKRIWDGVDPDRYVREQREGWS